MFLFNGMFVLLPPYNSVQPGVTRIFQWGGGGGGGETGSNNTVMSFSPRNIVGCLLKKRLTKGGHGHPRNPQLRRWCG